MSKIVKPIARRWNYSGDINLEHGGFYWQESGYSDHVNAVEVIPMSDVGGADCQFLIRVGSIFMSDDISRIAQAINCTAIAYKDATRGDCVMAVNAYYGFDDCTTHTVQIGKLTAYDPVRAVEFEPDYILRGNTSLRRFVRTEFLNLSR